MRTEIARRYQSGFILTEQELRRITQSGQEHAAKIGANDTVNVIAKLKDGSLIEADGIDDVLSLENGGQKAIVSLTLRWDDDKQPIPKSSIIVHFEDGVTNPKNWDSTLLVVVGESRDAAFVAASPIRRPPTAGFALRVIDHSPGNVNFAPESS